MLNIPNTLTILRFFLIPVFIFKLLKGDVHTAFLVFVVAAVTDMLDGYIAKKFSQITFLGRILDPLADKVMIIGAFVALYLSDLPVKANAVLLYFVYLKEFYTILGIGCIYYLEGKVEIKPSIFGKATTFLESFAVIYFLFVNLTGAFHFLSNYVTAAVVASIIISIVSYTLDGINYLTGESIKN